MINLSVKKSGRFSFIVKMLIYSFFYGLFVINIIDLTTKSFWGYHLFLVSLYFFPFITVVLILGFDDWELLFSLGLLSSLMNDLFYALIGNIFFHIDYNLREWYLQQLGFMGDKYLGWDFNGGFFTIPVTSILMGVSIYARIILVFIILRKWWSEK
ncbi:MAG: hypothetical protein ACPL3B_02525 [Fervidobacterium sp.]